MAVDLTSLKAGDKVMRKCGSTRNDAWRECIVNRVGRKYLYLQSSYGYEEYTPYSRVDGRGKGGFDRITTPELLEQERHEAALDSMIKSARLGDMFYYSSGWTLADKERLYSLLKEMGKVL